MVSQKYRGSCIGAALAKWLAKNTVASQKMALKEKMEDGALEMLLPLYHLITPQKLILCKFKSFMKINIIPSIYI